MKLSMPESVARDALDILSYTRSAPRYTGHTGDDGSLYCRHGVYLGTWWGGDYMCGYCEDGVSDHAYALHIAWSRWRNAQRQAATEALYAIFPVLSTGSRSHPEWRQYLTDITWDTPKW